MDKKISKPKQLAAASTAFECEAARILDVYHVGRLNGVPPRTWFSERFHFSPNELAEYIKTNRLGQRLLQKSYDNRGTPSAYLMEVPGGYQVGWCTRNAELIEKHFHGHIDDAATDFVLLYWGLGRYGRHRPPS